MRPKTNIPHFLRRAGVVVGSTMLATGSWAQQAPSASSPTEDEIINLSPFEVTTSKNRGYEASHTVSGTRLNTKLEDIAASVTVVTKQQLQDTASVDINDIFLFEAGTEGIYQYTDYSYSGTGGTSVQVDNTGTRPSAANRIRGVGSAQMSLGGFEMTGDVPIDTYNVDAVEINRGPNSNIFGLGGAAGTVNLVAGEANLTKQKGTVVVQGDSYGGTRASADYNLPIYRDKFAVRLSVVNEDKGFTRKPAYDKTNRFAISGAYRPFKKTTIRGYYEKYRNKNSLPNSLTPLDYVTPWVQAGSPTWNPLTATLRKPDGTILASNVSFNNAGTQLYLPGYGVYAGSSFSNRITQFIDQGNLALYSIARGSTISSSATTIPGPTAGQNNQYYISTGLVYPAVYNTLWKPVGISDKSIYNWEDINMAGANYASMESQIVRASIEQFILDTREHKLVAQVAFAGQHNERQERNFVGSTNGIPSALMVDINEYMLDGTKNPFFGRPFMAGSEPWKKWSPEKNATYRGQLAYQLDLTDRSNKWINWIGRQNLVGYGETRERIYGTPQFRDYIVSDHTWLPALQSNGQHRTLANSSYRQTYRYYLGDASADHAIDYAPQGLVNAGGWHDLYWQNGKTGQWVTEPVRFEEVHDANRMTRENRYTWGGVWQGSFWKDRIVPTLGWREDRIRTYEGPSRTWDPNTGYPDLSVMWNFDDYDKQNTAFSYTKNYNTGRTKTAGLVVKPLSWMHLHYNQSDSFNPGSLAYNVLAQALPNPRGEGKDYGVTFILLDGRLAIKYNQYDVVEEYARAGSDVASKLFRMDFNQERGDQDLVAGSRDSWNIEGVAWQWVMSSHRITPDQQATLSASEIDQYRREAWDKYVKMPFSTWDWVMSGNKKVLSDSSLSSAHGREVEISFNPNKYWTLKGNVVNRRASFSESSIANNEYISNRFSYWTSLKIPTDFMVYNGSAWVPAGSTGNTASYDVWGKAGDSWWTTNYGSAPNNGMAAGATTPKDWYMQNINVSNALANARSGQMKPQMSKWSANMTTSYSLAGLHTENFLKKMSVGGSIRWDDKQIIGYYASAPGALDNGVYRTYDVSRPIYNKANTQVDLMTNYRFKLFKGRIGCNVQLNVRNVFESGGLRVVGVNPDGVPTTFRIIDPRRFILSATFDL